MGNRRKIHIHSSKEHKLLPLIKYTHLIYQFATRWVVGPRECVILGTLLLSQPWQTMCTQQVFTGQQCSSWRNYTIWLHFAYLPSELPWPLGFWNHWANDGAVVDRDWLTSTDQVILSTLLLRVVFCSVYPLLRVYVYGVQISSHSIMT